VAAGGAIDQARSKGGAAVSHGAASGIYCIAIPGISSDSSIMSVNLDFDGSATASPPASMGDDLGTVEVDFTPTAPCTAGQFEVRTLSQMFNPAGGHIGNNFIDQPFVFSVP
jgi:hypothetical protein